MHYCQASNLNESMTFTREDILRRIYQLGVRYIKVDKFDLYNNTYAFFGDNQEVYKHGDIIFYLIKMFELDNVLNYYVSEGYVDLVSVLKIKDDITTIRGGDVIEVRGCAYSYRRYVKDVDISRGIIYVYADGQDKNTSSGNIDQIDISKEEVVKIRINKGW